MAIASIVVLASALFVTTNVDDLFVLAAFYADRRFRARDVVVGQYAGMAAITLGSLALSLAALAIPSRSIGFLGLVPLALGLRVGWSTAWSRLRERDDDDEPRADGKSSGALAVAAVTIANGADNVAAYVPVFASRKAPESAAIIALFAILTGVWCLLAHRLVHHPMLGAPLRRYGSILLPLVLIALGIFILIDGGAHLVVAGALRG